MIINSKKAEKHILKIKEHHSKMLADMEFMKQKKENDKIVKQQAIQQELARRQAIGEQIRARKEKEGQAKIEGDKAMREHSLKEKELDLKGKSFNKA